MAMFLFISSVGLVHSDDIGLALSDERLKEYIFPESTLNELHSFKSKTGEIIYYLIPGKLDDFIFTLSLYAYSKDIANYESVQKYRIKDSRLEFLGGERYSWTALRNSSIVINQKSSNGTFSYELITKFPDGTSNRETVEVHQKISFPVGEDSTLILDEETISISDDGFTDTSFIRRTFKKGVGLVKLENLSNGEIAEINVRVSKEESKNILRN